MNWEVEWNYNGWINNPHFPSGPEVWKNTVITKINEMSAQIYKSSLIGGADTLVMTRKTFDTIIVGFEYLTFSEEDGKWYIGKRFAIDIQDDFQDGIIDVFKREYPMEPRWLDSPENSFFMIHEDSPELPEIMQKIMDGEIKVRGGNVISSGQLHGRITILNMP
jgi:hypothetical protein